MDQTLQSQLKEQITRNIGEVLQSLKRIFANNAKLLNDTILLLLRYEELLSEKRQDTLSPSEYNRENNKLNLAVLELIDRISEEEALAYEAENSIFQKILIICPNEDRKKYMSRLFPKQYYKNTEYDWSGKKLPLETIDEYQLLVFDDMESTDEYFALYGHYLANATPYILYFGKRRVPDRQGEKLKAYFTNSDFSLHARLQEMMTYIKYTQDSKK
jgi:hypothetical protein